MKNILFALIFIFFNLSINAVSYKVSKASYDKVAIVSHGFDPENGPNYNLIKKMVKLVKKAGWYPVVPDFRDTYKSDVPFDRKARVSKIVSLIKSLPKSPRELILIGHSQGGSASLALSILYRDLLTENNLKGLFLLAPESVLGWDELKEEDGMTLRDPSFFTLILHPRGDDLIPYRQLKLLSNVWKETPLCLIPSESKVPAGAKDETGMCKHHDFQLKEHLEEAERKFTFFLEEIKTRELHKPFVPSKRLRFNQ